MNGLAYDGAWRLTFSGSRLVSREFDPARAIERPKYMRPREQCNVKGNLMWYVENRIPICPRYFSRKAGKHIPIKEVYRDRTKWITSERLLDYWLLQGAESFQFIPADNGLLCLDVDIKEPYHGLDRLYALVCADTGDRHAFAERLVSWVKVVTPSGGLHLYFWYNGNRRVRYDLGDGLEVKYGGQNLTCAGSKKGDCYYVFTVFPAAIPVLNENTPLAKAIFKKDTPKPYTPTKRRYIGREISEGYGKIPMDTLAYECGVSGHHTALVHFVGKCKRVGYNESECLHYALNRPDLFGNKRDEVVYQVNYMWRHFK